jgi:Protein of unknown function (DUF2550)
MLIALLALLGVDLIVVVVLLAFVLGRKLWVKRQPGAFRGAIRVTRGEVDGLSAKWRRGYGRWVRDILVWTKAPLLFRNEVLAVDQLNGNGLESAEHIKRLGDHPLVMELRIGGATVEVAAGEDDRDRLVGTDPDGGRAAGKEPHARSSIE